MAEAGLGIDFESLGLNGVKKPVPLAPEVPEIEETPPASVDGIDFGSLGLSGAALKAIVAPQAPELLPTPKQPFMRQAFPAEMRVRPLAPDPFATALQEAAGAALATVPGGLPLPESLAMPGVHEAITEAAKEMAIEITPPVADIIAKQPLGRSERGDTFVSPISGKTYPRPQTVGEVLSLLSEVATKQDPLISRMKERAQAVVRIDPSSFESESGFRSFVEDYNKATGFATGLVPESPLEMGERFIDVVALVAGAGAARSFANAVAKGMRGPALKEFSAALAAAGRAARGGQVEALASKGEMAARAPIDAARRFMGDMKAFFGRKGRLPGAADADEFKALQQPSLPLAELREVEKLAAIEAPLQEFALATERAPVIHEIAALAKALPSQGELFQGRYPQMVELSGIFHDPKAVTIQQHLQQFATRKKQAAALAREPRALSTLKFPDRTIGGWGENGQAVVRMVKGRDLDRALLYGEALTEARPAFVGLTDAEKRALIALGDPIERDAILGLEPLAATMAPEQSVAEVMKRILPALPAKSRAKVVSAHAQLADGMDVVAKRAKNVAPGDFVDEMGEFNSQHFNKYNYFGYFFDTVDDKIKRKIIEVERKLLGDSEEFLAKKASLSKEAYELELAIKTQENSKRTIQSFREGRMLYPEQGWNVARHGLQGHSDDLEKVYKRTVDAFSDRIARVERFGVNDSKFKFVQDLLMADPPAGFDAGLLNSYFRLVTDGQIPEISRPITKMVAAYNVITKMVLSPLSNSVEFLSKAPAKIGFRKTLDIIKSSAGRSLIRGAETMDLPGTKRLLQEYIKVHGKDEFNEFVHSVIEGTKRSALAESTGIPLAEFEGSKLFTKMLTPEQALQANRFDLVTTINRQWSMHAGRYYAEREARALKKAGLFSEDGRLAARRLQELGVSDHSISQAAHNGKLPDYDRNRAALAFSDELSSITGPTNLPLFMQSDMARLWLQFWGPALRHALWIKDGLMGATAGGARDRAKFGAYVFAAGAAAGVPVSVMKDFLSGKPGEEFATARLGRAVLGPKKKDDYGIMRSLILTLGAANSLGAWEGLALALAPESKRKGAQLAGRGVLGPSLSEAADALTALDALKQGEVAPAGKFVVSRGLPLAAAMSGSPTAFGLAALSARAIAGALFPKKGKPPAIVEVPAALAAATAAGVGAAADSLKKKPVPAARVTFEPGRRQIKIPGSER